MRRVCRLHWVSQKRVLLIARLFGRFRSCMRDMVLCLRGEWEQGCILLPVRYFRCLSPRRRRWRALRGVVESVAGVGHVLGAGRPLAILRVGVPTIRFRATAASLSTVKQGALVKISGLKGRVVEGSVTSVSGFRGADSQQASLQPGYEVVVSFTEPPAADEFPTGQSVTVTDAATPPPSLAVPQVAIKQDASGPYVLKAPKDDSGHPGRVSVTVLAQSDGWVAIAAEGLVAGDRVQVQP